MTEYKCKECKTKWYSADPYSKEPCENCGGELEREEG